MNPLWLLAGFWLVCSAAVIIGFVVADWRERRRRRAWDAHTLAMLRMVNHPTGRQERIGPPMEWLP